MNIDSAAPRPAGLTEASGGELFYSVVAGLVCGVAATGPMTASMILGHRALPREEQYPLPPEEITAQTFAPALDRRDQRLPLVTLCAHFGYGGVAGALYGLLAKPERSAGRAGLVLGGLVWGLSYFGLLPATGLLSSGWRHPVRRSLLMLAAHFVWGVALTGLHRLLMVDQKRASPALRTVARVGRDWSANGSLTGASKRYSSSRPCGEPMSRDTGLESSQLTEHERPHTSALRRSGEPAATSLRRWLWPEPARARRPGLPARSRPGWLTGSTGTNESSWAVCRSGCGCRGLAGGTRRSARGAYASLPGLHALAVFGGTGKFLRLGPGHRGERGVPLKAQGRGTTFTPSRRA